MVERWWIHNEKTEIDWKSKGKNEVQIYRTNLKLWNGRGDKITPELLRLKYLILCWSLAAQLFQLKHYSYASNEMSFVYHIFQSKCKVAFKYSTIFFTLLMLTITRINGPDFLLYSTIFNLYDLFSSSCYLYTSIHLLNEILIVLGISLRPIILEENIQFASAQTMPFTSQFQAYVWVLIVHK